MARHRFVLVAAALTLMAGAVPAVGEEFRPENDEFDASTIVYELPFESTVDNSSAGVDVGEPQPSCGPTKRTVWYAIAPEGDVNLVADSSAMFRSTLAVYRGTGLTDLAEIGCESGASWSKAEFRALAGNTYFIQLGSAGSKHGLVDFRLSPSVWQERTLHEFDHTITTDGTNLSVFELHGQPRPSNPSIYDVTMRVADQPSSTVGILTFGLVNQKIDLKFVNLPPRAGRLITTIGYRYDSSQYQCLADSGEGSKCVAKSPIKDLKWLTEGDGRRAELVVTVKAVDGNTTVAERTITIPFLGQIAGLP